MPAGTILGKTHCEYFCFSGGSHTNATGPVHNPYRMGYSAGARPPAAASWWRTGEADMALGGDQGGAIRNSLLLLRPLRMEGGTHGLVPYTGIMPIEITLDHVGADDRHGPRQTPSLLEVIAGPDGLDPRQYAPKVAD